MQINQMDHSELEVLKRMFIRPPEECTPEYVEQQMFAGTVMNPFRCRKCLEYAVVNNVCFRCGRDERARYGDFFDDPATWHTRGQVRAVL